MRLKLQANGDQVYDVLGFEETQFRGADNLC